MELKQYFIVLVNLDPTIGSEIKKTRPCVIVSPNEMNKYLNTIVVAPMITNLKKYPTRVAVEHNNKNGMLAIDQIRTIDKKRILKRFDQLTKSEIKRCKEIIRETFVD
ncbi:type II toxin-antitoxin system PemK/MazF family toxin [Mesonia sp. MT50]|uniref:mRNA interferase n=1 Tax=Mesonia profundi TaxID=3070998 RepID=A0ABU0ZXK0_9FLAO|nr:type II toxin-antitoxin system PemK/MazF family toxin [Mesonia profundi]MDQ7916171.1 type II toxin-antitoxin system PemK/MazF family toxin [Mesonia profundi]